MVQEQNKAINIAPEYTNRDFAKNPVVESQNQPHDSAQNGDLAGFNAGLKGPHPQVISGVISNGSGTINQPMGSSDAAFDVDSITALQDREKNEAPSQQSGQSGGGETYSSDLSD